MHDQERWRLILGNWILKNYGVKLKALNLNGKVKVECQGPDVSELNYICIISELTELSFWKISSKKISFIDLSYFDVLPGV